MEIAKLTFVVVLLQGAFSSSLETSNTSNVTCQFETNGICLPEGYSKHKSPEPQINVGVKFQIEKITEINDEHSTIGVLVYLEIEWKDERLKQANYSGNETILDNYWSEELLWLPDIFVYKMKEVLTPEILIPFQSAF